jgi:D-glycero-D-manno-heptose 1,7-bisphosphate phosphatase
VLVLTGYGRGDLLYVAPGAAIQPRHVAEDLYAAVQWILQDMAARTSGS